MLSAAIEAEVQEYVSARHQLVNEQGHRQGVRNGYLPERSIQIGVCSVRVRQPRVHDRRPEEQRATFSSKILPPYLRKTKSIETLLPWLYLKGISSGQFDEALGSLLESECRGLSASTVTRLTKVWQEEHVEWSQRYLEDKQYAYIWADGIYLNVRLEDDKVCLLVIMGATPEGKKELIAVMDGYRESEQSWRELLVDLKSRGLDIASKVAVGDGALGFWQALTKIFPETRHQRCRGHKTANILDKLPKKCQPHAKEKLHAI